jgi:hypothetical protein
VEDGVVITEEVDFVNSERMSSYFFNNVLDEFISTDLHEVIVTGALLRTLTFLL